MKKLFKRLPLFLLILTLLSTQRVLAHGDDPRLEISAEKLIPGSTLDIRGVSFEENEEINLTLAGPQNEIPLGVVTADTEGVFLLTITLPVDLVQGTYMIRATTDDHVVDSAALTIWGTADLGGGEEGPREEEDPLLAPIPTAAAGVPTPLLDSSSAIQPASPATKDTQQKSSTPTIWVIGGIGTVVVLALFFLGKR